MGQLLLDGRLSMTPRLRVLSITLGALLGTRLAAQTRSELSLLRAAATEIWSGAKPDSTVYLDPRVMPSSRNHSASALATLVEVLGARVARSEDVIQCAHSDAFSCRFAKGSLLISVGEPSVVGDTASVRVRLDQATREPRMPVSSEDILLILARQPQGDWKVIARRRERIT